MIEDLNKFADQLTPFFLDGDPTAKQKSLEHDTMKVVDDFYRAAASGDIEKMSATISDEIEFHLHGPPDFDWAASCVGKGPYFEIMAKNFSTVEKQNPQTTRVICQGDTVVVCYTDEGTIRATGKRYKVSGVHILTIREGRVARMESILDSGSLMNAMK